MKTLMSLDFQSIGNQWKDSQRVLVIDLAHSLIGKVTIALDGSYAGLRLHEWDIGIYYVSIMQLHMIQEVTGAQAYSPFR